MTGGGQRSFHLFRALAARGRVDVLLVSEESCAAYERDVASWLPTFPDAGRVLIQRSTPQFLVWPQRHIGRFEQAVFFSKRLHMALRSRANFYRPTDGAREALRQAIAAEGYDLLVGRYLQVTALAGVFEQNAVPVVVDLDDLDEKVIESRLDAANTPWARRWLLRHQAGQVDRVVGDLRARPPSVHRQRKRPCPARPNVEFGAGQQSVPARRRRQASAHVVAARQYRRPVRGQLRSSAEPRRPAALHRRVLAADHGTAEMADACVGLLGAPARRDALAAAGRAIVDANFSFDTVQKAVDAALADIRPHA